MIKSLDPVSVRLINLLLDTRSMPEADFQMLIKTLADDRIKDLIVKELLGDL